MEAHVGPHWAIYWSTIKPRWNSSYIPFERNSVKQLCYELVQISYIFILAHYNNWHCAPVYCITVLCYTMDWYISFMSYAFCWLFWTVLELDAAADPHVFIYTDEFGFNLAKIRHRGETSLGSRPVFWGNVRGTLQCVLQMVKPFLNSTEDSFSAWHLKVKG